MRWWFAGAAAGMFIAGGAQGSGFAIREQSSTFQGLSFAGVAAGGADISTMYFNPATLGLHDDNQVHLSAAYIIPRSEFSVDEASTVLGTPITGPEGGDIAVNAVVPATYAMIAAGDWRFGLGITAPFGLRTEQPADWVGRYHATESDLKTININPAVAYTVAPGLTVAAGFVAQYADATLGQAVDFGSAGVGLGVPGSVSGGNDGLAEVKGDDWDYGFTLGLLAEPLDGTRIGLGYRSQINHSLTGDAAFALGGPIGRAISGAMGSFVDTGGRAAISTPQVANLGIRQEVTDKLDVLGTVEWTGWSTFEDLIVTFDNPAQQASVTPERWRDTWFFALGAEYQPREDLTLQVGAAFDQSPIRNGFRTPRIPGNDRTWLSVGVAWAPRPWLDVGAGYSRIWVADGDVNLESDNLGTLRGSFDNGIDIIALQGTLRF